MALPAHCKMQSHLICSCTAEGSVELTTNHQTSPCQSPPARPISSCASAPCSLAYLAQSGWMHWNLLTHLLHCRCLSHGRRDEELQGPAGRVAGRILELHSLDVLSCMHAAVHSTPTRDLSMSFLSTAFNACCSSGDRTRGPDGCAEDVDAHVPTASPPTATSPRMSPRLERPAGASDELEEAKGCCWLPAGSATTANVHHLRSRVD
jgi:hypothetical protein